MTASYRRMLQLLAGVGIFVLGIAAGSLHARGAAVQNRFGQPKTVLHVVVYKFRDNVSNYDREKAINGIKDMAAKIPGIKNIWLKTERNQIRDFSGVYAIEFTSAEAGADYAESEVVGADLVKARGGRIVLATLVPGQSTTAMIERDKVPAE